jgi:DNA-binding beta-propeller fold protein YncE
LNYFFRYLPYTFLFILPACTKDVGNVNRGDYPLAIGKLISKNCAVSGCHNTASYKAAASFNLDTWASLFLGSNNGSAVIPYNSRFSSLCYFINSYAELGSRNTPLMPLNGKALSYDEVKQIKDWIDDGASNINGKVMWADNPLQKKLYAVNQGCDVVTVFDSDTQLPMRYIDVGTKSGSDIPHHLRISPDGKYWYVIFINNNIMQKFRCSDDSYVGQIPLTPFAAGWSTNPQSDAINWNTFVISKDGKRAYCASLEQSGHVAAVDLQNMKLLHYRAAVINSHGVALNAAENQLYVTAQTGNFITRMDTSFLNADELPIDNTNFSNYATSIDPHDIILSPDGLNFLITCQKTNEVRVFNIATQKVNTIIPTGTFPQEIIYSKNVNQYFVSCTNDVSNGANGSVSRIEGNTYAYTKLNCGYQPHGIAIDENRKILYVLSRNLSTAGPAPHHTSECAGRNGFVNFVDLTTFTLMPKKYELSVDPYFIYARP